MQNKRHTFEQRKTEPTTQKRKTPTRNKKQTIHTQHKPITPKRFTRYIEQTSNNTNNKRKQTIIDRMGTSKKNKKEPKCTHRTKQ